MSTWKKKAMECLPDLKKEFEKPGTSIYDVFMELLPATAKAHENNDTDQLKKIYDFAEWCFRQKAKDLWNAAGVSFYEHLEDREQTRQTMHKWVKPDIYKEIRPLLELRLDKSTLKMIDDGYGFNQKRL